MTKAELAKLQEIRQQLTDEHMSRCGFQDSAADADADERDILGSEATVRLVVSATSLWRESWILPALDEVIAKYEEKKSQ